MSDYEVGYGKPPKSGQAKPGICHNPTGRRGKKPKPSADETVASILKRIGEETITVGDRKMTKLEAEIRVLQSKAMKGDMSATKMLNQMRNAPGFTDNGENKGGVLVVPAPMNFDDWGKAAYEQQAKFRERDPDLDAEISAFDSRLD